MFVVWNVQNHSISDDDINFVGISMTFYDD